MDVDAKTDVDVRTDVDATTDVDVTTDVAYLTDSSAEVAALPFCGLSFCFAAVEMETAAAIAAEAAAATIAVSSSFCCFSAAAETDSAANPVNQKRSGFKPWPFFFVKIVVLILSWINMSKPHTETNKKIHQNLIPYNFFIFHFMIFYINNPAEKEMKVKLC